MTLQVQGAPAPRIAQDHGASAPGIVQVDGPRIPDQPIPPPPPEYPPDMKDTIAITNSIHALSPRIVAVHGPTGAFMVPPGQENPLVSHSLSHIGLAFLRGSSQN